MDYIHTAHNRNYAWRRIYRWQHDNGRICGEFSWLAIRWSFAVYCCCFFCLFFFWRNQPIKINFRGTYIISFYYKTKDLFIHLYQVKQNVTTGDWTSAVCVTGGHSTTSLYPQWNTFHWPFQPFGFLLVMFPSSYFVFVFLSLWCLWWRCGIIVSIPDHCLPFCFVPQGSTRVSYTYTRWHTNV